MFFSFDFVTIGRKIEIIIFWGDLIRELRPEEVSSGECHCKEFSFLSKFRPEEFYWSTKITVFKIDSIEEMCIWEVIIEIWPWAFVGFLKIILMMPNAVIESGFDFFQNC